jgi:hypothetical protein
MAWCPCFGTYVVDEARKLIDFRVERSAYPNQATGKDSSRLASGRDRPHLSSIGGTILNL